jgi:L-threonylcarbamoyladenylate synthase
MPLLNAASPLDVELAARTLAAGDLVAFPTETVYGLGARADDDRAVAKIFAAKGRPSDHPLIVHVADVAQVEAFAADWPPAAQGLARAFWPGPLTLIVPRRAGVATAAAGGAPTIGLRCPDHPLTWEWLRQAAALGVPGVAGPSANRFGRVSPTCAAHVVEEFGDALVVLDGDACREGIESAIVDCSRDEPALLRPGTLGRDVLAQWLLDHLGLPLRSADASAPRAPGTLASHYAPRARVHLLPADALAREFHTRLEAPVMTRHGAPRLGLYASPACLEEPAWPSDVTVTTLDPAGLPRQRGTAGKSPCVFMPQPETAAAMAHELFAVLRALDDAGVSDILVQLPPEAPAWEGIRDRLQRAATR